MTPIGRAFRNLLERMLKRFYEGPDPPCRLGQGVTAFAVYREHATVGEWIDFATQSVEQAYQAGYVRGVEASERQLDLRPKDDPELLLDRRNHDWSWVDLAPPPDALERVPTQEREMDPEVRALELDTLGRQVGGYRVVVVDGLPRRRA